MEKLSIKKGFLPKRIVCLEENEKEKCYNFTCDCKTYLYIILQDTKVKNFECPNCGTDILITEMNKL